MRIAFASTLLLLTLGASADEPDRRRLAFEPRVQPGGADAACAIVATAVRRRMLVAEPEHALDLETADATTRADFDADGRPDRLVFSSTTTRGSAEGYAIFAAAADDTEMPGHIWVGNDPPELPRIFPAVGGRVSDGTHEWRYIPGQIVRIGERWFSIEHDQWSGSVAFEPTVLYRIEPGFRPRELCRIDVADRHGRTPEQRLQHPRRKALRELLDTMSGREGDCGTLGSLLGRIQDRHRVERRAIVSPWSLPPAGPSRFEELRRYWRLVSPGNIEVADAIPGAIAAWRRQLAKHYRRGFGMPRADALAFAERAIAAELAHGFSVGYEVVPPTQRERAIEALLAARDDAAVSRAIDAVPAGDWPDALHFAVLNSRAIAPLVARGHDVDAATPFGKTALMYAAQYDAGHAVAELLAGGADVARTTRAADDTCYYALQATRVSALHYAVRYASRPLIEQLLAAGASKTARDSKDLTPLDWLARHGPANPNLSKRDRAKLAAALAP